MFQEPPPKFPLKGWSGGIVVVVVVGGWGMWGRFGGRVKESPGKLLHKIVTILLVLRRRARGERDM